MAGNIQYDSLGVLHAAPDELDEQEIIRRIRAIACHGWDPLGDGEVLEGGYVLADCAFPGDEGEQDVQECARGLILRCTEDRTCHIALLNRGCGHVTRVTMRLPDDRNLHPISDAVEDGYSDCSVFSE